MAKSIMMDIPQDIIDNIIAAFGDDTCSLKQCSLVSSSFLLPSRKRLFSKIDFRSDQICDRIHQFLVQNPLIQASVRSISLSDSGLYSEWMNSTSLLAILRLPLCSLESFSIRVQRNFWTDRWHWNCFSSEMKDALSKIMFSSTLKTLRLYGIAKVPIIFNNTHLTTLELGLLSPNDFGNENSSSLTSRGVAPMASHTVIDRCIWNFTHKHVIGTNSLLLLIFH
jgi:hypothetical protein